MRGHDSEAMLHDGAGGGAGEDGAATLGHRSATANHAWEQGGDVGAAEMRIRSNYACDYMVAPME